MLDALGGGDQGGILDLRIPLQADNLIAFGDQASRRVAFLALGSFFSKRNASSIGVFWPLVSVR